MTILKTYSLIYFSLTAIVPASGFAQVIQGPFNFRHLQLVADASGRIIDSRTLSGTMTVSQPGFYASGTLLFSGTQVIGAGGPAPFSVSGVYSSGLPTATTLTNPQDSAVSINARYGGFGVLGSSTESSPGTVDLFVATPVLNGFLVENFVGAYFLTYIEFGGGVRSFFAKIMLDGAGNVNLVSAQSHVGSGAPETTASGHGSYTVSSDGTGTIRLPPIGSFPAAVYAIHLGPLYFAFGGKQASAQDFLMLEPANGYPDSALNQYGGSTGLGNQYSTSGLHVDASGVTSPSAYVGTVNAFPGMGELAESRRTHSSGGTYDFTGARAIEVDNDATARSGTNLIGLGLGTWISSEQGSVDPSGHEINVAFETGSTIIGSDLFLYPLAIVNSASFAPPILPVSPGEFLTMYLWGPKAPTEDLSALPPYSTSLRGFSVTANGEPVPITAIQLGALNVILPADLSGPKVTLQVRNGTTTSNSVDLPFARTTPGVFTQNSNGLGNAAALHGDYTPITVDHPAKAEEVILLYLAGLGSVTPPVLDGILPGMSPPSRVTTSIKVLISDMPAEVQFAGLAPGSPGLYQLNIKVPSGVVPSTSAVIEIQTPEFVTRQATLPIR